MSSFNPSGSVAFVTGTNKPNGIGRAVVKALLEAGAKKVYATARDTAQLTDLVSESKGRVEAVALDVIDPKATSSLGSRFPDVQLLVNNAGVYAGPEGDPKSAQLEVEVNYLGPLQVTRGLESALRSHKASSGRVASAIVNMVSIAGLVSFPTAETYSASKAAAHSLTQAQRRAFPETLVVGVYPGPVDTAMTEKMTADKAEPAMIAKSIIDALLTGQEDVFPDATAQGLYAAWKEDAKALESKMAQPQG